MEEKADLRQLPSIEKLVTRSSLRGWDEKLDHPIRIKLAQKLVSQWRQRLLAGENCPPVDALCEELGEKYERLFEKQMKKVINATGVVLHTNLGRAPLGKEVLKLMAQQLDGYCNLEFDLETGERGSRTAFIEELFQLVCGVESAVVVNNNAAALFLILHTFARDKEVLISRGELVQIGGGFRIPEILQAAGSKLVEVGTTNMTYAEDFQSALTELTSILLKVHQSNFSMTGHTANPTLASLSTIARAAGVVLAVDLGSGLLKSVEQPLSEWSVEEVLKEGADLVCFSGDKLLGGPQAGIILGTKALVSKLKRSPLYRALRLGKTELFLLEQTLLSHASGLRTPTWELIEQTPELLKMRCERVQKALIDKIPARVVVVQSAIGGGTLPACELPSYAVAMAPDDPERVARNLLATNPAVVVRHENKNLLLDLRTVSSDDESLLIKSLREALSCTC